MRAVAFAATTALVLGASCTSPLGGGEFGQFRYVGKLRGAVPLAMIPPISDFAGNIYTVSGAIDVPEAHGWISPVGGGETACTASHGPGSFEGGNLNKGDKFGVHGWVGFSNDRVWLWAGDALAQLNGTSRFCNFVLDTDPGTNSALFFKAVFPWIRDAPSRVTAVGLVTSQVDPNPFAVRVDLNLNIFTTINPFQPVDARDVQVIGVGADRDEGVGFVVLQYRRGDAVTVEGRFYDEDANLVSVTGIASEPLPEYGVRGYLHKSSKGLIAGLVADDRIIAFDKSSGTVIPLDKGAMTAVGVHEDAGTLWLVGAVSGQPAIARLDNGGKPAAPQPWQASQRAATTLAGGITVIDDRTLPARSTEWQPAKSAMGIAPFVSEHSMSHHATGETLWVAAGPSFEFSGGTQTSFAVAPVGVSYP